MDLQLQDVHVLITGASGGIGVEAVRLFLDHGAKVTAQYNTSPSALSVFEKDKAAFCSLQADLTSEEQVSRLFADAHAKWGPVQVLVLSHGIWPTADTPIVDMSLERWSRTISTNLTSCFLCTRAYLQGLRAASDAQKQYASVVIVGSAAGKVGEASHTDYATSKSGLMYGFTLSLKNEIVKIAPRGRVNCIAPGWTITPMSEEALKSRSIVYTAIATTPLKKFANVTDVASQIVVIASPRVSGHVTGQVVMVAGGMEGRLLNMPEDVELPP